MREWKAQTMPRSDLTKMVAIDNLDLELVSYNGGNKRQCLDYDMCFLAIPTDNYSPHVVKNT